MFGGELRQCFCLLQQLLNGLSFEGGSVNFFHRASLPYLSDLGVQFMGSSIYHPLTKIVQLRFDCEVYDIGLHLANDRRASLDCCESWIARRALSFFVTLLHHLLAFRWGELCTTGVRTSVA